MPQGFTHTLAATSFQCSSSSNRSIVDACCMRAGTRRRTMVNAECRRGQAQDWRSGLRVLSRVGCPGQGEFASCEGCDFIDRLDADYPPLAMRRLALAPCTGLRRAKSRRARPSANEAGRSYHLNDVAPCTNGSGCNRDRRTPRWDTARSQSEGRVAGCAAASAVSGAGPVVPVAEGRRW